jgi:hypothetical protein
MFLLYVVISSASISTLSLNIWGCIRKFPDWVDNEINYNKHSLRNNTNGYGGKSHWTDSQNNDITATSGKELYHLQLSRQAANPESFGYSLVLMLWNSQDILG